MIKRSFFIVLLLVMCTQSNGYFFIPQDGDQVEMQTYEMLEYNNPDLGSSPGVEGTEYLWWSGFETVNNIETLLFHQSREAINGPLWIIGWEAYIDNEYREYKTVFDLDTPSTSRTYILDPYDALPLDLVPGDTYSHTYTEKELDSREVFRSQMNITEVAYDGVTTHFNTYDDCIRYTIDYNGLNFDTGEVCNQEMVFWFCKGVGQVRTIMSMEGEYGYTLIADTHNMYN